jgi:hypothetical protein
MKNLGPIYRPAGEVDRYQCFGFPSKRPVANVGEVPIVDFGGFMRCPRDWKEPA